jgi:mitochondrial fission protein ELM1
MLLVGGSTTRHLFDPATARRLGEEVRAFTQAAGGSVFVTTSRRTGPEATAALKSGLGEFAYLHEWQPGQQDNPYLAYLALADMLVVTGESESMLAEAAASGKPLYIYPFPTVERLPHLTARLKARLKDWTVAHAYARPRENAWLQRATASLCTFLIASGAILPRRDLHELHQALIHRGLARPFGEPLEARERPPLREVEEVAQRVRALLGLLDS